MSIEHVRFARAAQITRPPVERTAVSAVMTPRRSFVTVPPEASCDEAERVAQEHCIRHVLVMEHDQLAGVMCLCDLHPPAVQGQHVDERMTRHVFAIDGDRTVAEAAEALSSLGIGCLPVLDGERVVGIVTRGDLRRAGVPEAALGAGVCSSCGSKRGVRTSDHGLDYCLACMDLLEAMSIDADLGEGD